MYTSVTFLEQYPEIIYGFSVCILTWIILYYFLSKPSKKEKFLVLLGSGILLGLIFYGILEIIRWPMMILAFLASIGFYEMIVKVIMRKFKKSYQDS